MFSNKGFFIFSINGLVKKLVLPKATQPDAPTPNQPDFA